MTKAELIAMLAHLPDEAEVLAHDDRSDRWEPVIDYRSASFHPPAQPMIFLHTHKD